MRPDPVRVLIVDDQQIFGDALAFFLEQQPQVQVVGVARAGVEAVERAVRDDADVVLMDVSLPDIDGFEATRRLLAIRRAARVVAMSAHHEDELTERIEACGMVGYVSKDRIHETVLAVVLGARG